MQKVLAFNTKGPIWVPLGFAVGLVGMARYLDRQEATASATTGSSWMHFGLSAPTPVAVPLLGAAAMMVAIAVTRIVRNRRDAKTATIQTAAASEVAEAAPITVSDAPAAPETAIAAASDPAPVAMAVTPPRGVRISLWVFSAFTVVCALVAISAYAMNTQSLDLLFAIPLAVFWIGVIAIGFAVRQGLKRIGHGVARKLAPKAAVAATATVAPAAVELASVPVATAAKTALPPRSGKIRLTGFPVASFLPAWKSTPKNDAFDRLAKIVRSERKREEASLRMHGMRPAM